MPWSSRRRGSSRGSAPSSFSSPSPPRGASTTGFVPIRPRIAVPNQNPPNHPNPRSPIPVPAKPRLPNQLDELIEKEKFLCCRLKHYISCIFSSLFWLSPMWF